jgi:hypothetical protein
MFWKKHKYLLILSSLILLFFCFSFVYALEIEYPSAGGQKPSEGTSFPDFVKYLFNFSIIISGVLAFFVIISSGVKILFSPDQADIIKDAKDKIIGAFVGIVILLASWLILTTINPNLSMLNLEPMQPTSGVYLFDFSGKKHYIADSNPDVGYEINSVEFISPKEELTAVYSGTGKRVDNSGPGSGGGGFSGRSIYFLWNKQGVYLYPRVNFEGKPLYTLSSIASLASQDFDNKTQSIRFNNKPEENITYGAVLFSDPDQKGKCGICGFDGDKIGDLSSPSSGNYFGVSVAKEGISSLALFFVHPKNITGDVTFYDDIDCKGNMKKYDNITDLYPNPDLSKDTSDTYFYSVNSEGSPTQAKNPDGKTILLYENIRSFEINGNFGVILNTEAEYKGKCQLFLKPSGTNCISTLVGSYVYDPRLDQMQDPIKKTPMVRREKVRSFIIIPLAQ